MGAVPVTVVTGFLGAGKTTLVNRWLARMQRGDVGVIVNEHGDAGIDGELLAERARELVEITGGCICCRTQTELVRALRDLAGRGVARILVETSGAASPAGVLRAVAGGGEDRAFALDGVITVADVTRLDVLAAHDLASEQIGYADIVVLSHTDVAADGDAIDRARGLVVARNGAALVVDGSFEAPLDDWLDRRRDDLVAARDAAPAAPPSAHVYESVSLVADGEVDGERFADFVETTLASVSGRIFRTKGILAVAGSDARMILQGVADRIDVSFGKPWGDDPRTSRLVVVGFGLDREGLVRAFASCAINPSDS